MSYELRVTGGEYGLRVRGNELRVHVVVGMVADVNLARARTINEGPSEMMPFIAERQNPVSGLAVERMRKRLQASLMAGGAPR